VTQSHKVQSARVVVEQTIRDLKCFKVMESNKIKSVEEFEKVLDCVIALHNLKVLLRKDENFDIPPRRAAIPGEHIFRPQQAEKDVDLKIPADKPDPNAPTYHHIRDFVNFLPSAAPAIKKAVVRRSQDHVFTPTVLERGKNLHDGAYVLQLRVQDEGLDIWTVKYIVGASYSYETHVGYFQLSNLNAALASICDCHSG
jgi:hypothetical protein